jgi:hypothetical protein
MMPKTLRLGRALIVLAAGLALLPLLAVDRPRLEPVLITPKPMFPVLTRLSMTNRPEPGGTARVTATVTAWAAGEPVEWRLDLPEGLSLVAGPDSWSGTLARGETRTFELLVSVPDGRHHEITARAWLPERPEARSADLLPIDLGALEGLKATQALVTGGAGTYIQYQGEVRPREAGE